jgi:N-acetylated-alpha-linked acidic dipeptidase
VVPGAGAALDTLLQGMEPALTSDEGLPGRPWYKHLIDAPGLFTGYGAKTMPGVREAIEQHHWDDTAQYTGITARAIQTYCDRLDAATALLRN